MSGHVRLFTAPWTIACQAPLSMRFSREEYWSGLPLPSPGDLPDPRIELRSLVSYPRRCSSSSGPRTCIQMRKQRVCSHHSTRVFSFPSTSLDLAFLTEPRGHGYGSILSLFQQFLRDHSVHCSGLGILGAGETQEGKTRSLS